MPKTELDQRCINTLRFLAVDGVQKANSGHPGMPMGMADVAYVLWTRFLKHNPHNPEWPNRDRFILSPGHGSMLLYGLLHLTGYPILMTDLKQFRQWDSKTAGHPEYDVSLGIEMTTGPLGQGFATGVGMAMAAKHLAARFNRPGYALIDHYIYALVSDGDLMEGVSHEAASLAGHLQLGNLIYLYDDNDISIEGSTDVTFTEDVGARFRAYGWHVQAVDGYDLDAIETAIRAAQAETARPSLIICRTHIAYGSPNLHDNAEAHGAPLGVEEVRLTKAALGWPPDEDFFVPGDALAHYRLALPRGAQAEAAWRDLLTRYEKEFPAEAAELRRIWSGTLPVGWEKALPVFRADQGMLATRAASGKVLNALAPVLPELIGGSADLAPSNNTYLKEGGDFQAATPAGRNLHFGVREHGMGAALNGMALYAPLRVYGGTFLVFSDYMRPAVRLAALMKLPVIYVWTHDSLWLGEDGPTHQPVEHLAALRAIPNLVVIRPADATETAAAWKVALERRDGPTALILSRQGLPIYPQPAAQAWENVKHGGYVFSECPLERTDLLLIASGSEVTLAMEAQKLLAERRVGARVVSLPSWELFDQQSLFYRLTVLPPDVPKRLALEAGVGLGWERYVGPQGAVLGLDRFGASAPAKVLQREFGFTPERVVERALALMSE